MNRDELADRVRSLNAERARPSPQPVPRRPHRRLWTQPLPEQTTDPSILLHQVIATLVQLYTTPPDEETP